MRRPLYVVLLAGYALGGAALYGGLPEQIPPLLTFPGGRAIWAGRVMVAFLLPTAVWITDALLRSLCVRHPVDKSGSANVLSIYDAIMVRFAGFIVVAHAAMLAGLLGVFTNRLWAAQIVSVTLGLAMISIGNLLPRTRPNLAIGIRTARTLSNRALWIRTHRSVGYMLVALGFIIVLSAIAVPPPVGPGMIHAVGPAGIVGAYVLMRYSSRQPHG